MQNNEYAKVQSHAFFNFFYNVTADFSAHSLMIVLLLKIRSGCVVSIRQHDFQFRRVHDPIWSH